MNKVDENIVKISVRNLVEFILKSGNIDNRFGGRKVVDAMQEGSRIHRKIQKRMGSNYRAEVPLAIDVPIVNEELELVLCVEGRADGIISLIHETPSIIIDEIKGVYMELTHLQEPIAIHLAQVKCYAYIYAKMFHQTQIGVRITYCNIETEMIKYFEEQYELQELETWFMKIIEEYAKWAVWQLQWRNERNQSIKELKFPFVYRTGQRDLVTNVYKSIIREKRLYIEAPTGVGKTISTIFPAIKAMGEGFLQKIFYLTAKTITRTVAEETLCILQKEGLRVKSVTITAKDKICIYDKSDCNPIGCMRAKGHFDRVNDAVFDIISHEDHMSRSVIEAYAEKYNVCPFELCLDITTWVDHIICDYNYAFDPNVYLRRFFLGEKKNPYIFLIDEAHNLVDRAREMYSATLYKHDFLFVKSLVKGKHKKLEKRLDACNGDLLKLKKECENCEVITNITDFVLRLIGLMTEFEEFFNDTIEVDSKEEIVTLYFQVRHFLAIYEIYNEKYITYTDYDEMEKFRIKLLCMDPSDNLQRCLERGIGAVFFSATLLPIHYYKEQLAGAPEDYAVYAPSPFDTDNRLLMIASDVSTKYSRRNDSEYQKIIKYILQFTEVKIGNYMVFFPSYQMMNQIVMLLTKEGSMFDPLPGLVIQKNNMNEMEKEEFLEGFVKNPKSTRIGFCVMGGIFSEGIDLKYDRLIGAVLVGTGLPMVSNERELFRDFYHKKNKKGYDYAYVYQGMNKVLQSAGRVIRTMEDRGAILLLDERYMKNEYQNLFPREWYPNIQVNLQNMKQELTQFWTMNSDLLE